MRSMSHAYSRRQQRWVDNEFPPHDPSCKPCTGAPGRARWSQVWNPAPTDNQPVSAEDAEFRRRLSNPLMLIENLRDEGGEAGIVNWFLPAGPDVHSAVRRRQGLLETFLQFGARVAGANDDGIHACPAYFNAVSTTCSTVNPNFFCNSLSGADEPKLLMPGSGLGFQWGLRRRRCACHCHFVPARRPCGSPRPPPGFPPFQERGAESDS